MIIPVVPDASTNNNPNNNNPIQPPVAASEDIRIIRADGNDPSQEGRVYFTAPITPCLDCNNLSSIWCFGCTYYMSLIHRRTISNSLLRMRNWAILVYMIEIVLCVTKLGLYSMRRNRYILFTNLVIIFANMVSLLGAIRFIFIAVVLGYMAVGLIVILTFIFLILTVAVSFADDSDIFAVYLPILSDFVFTVVLSRFIYLMYKWDDNATKELKRGQVRRSITENFDKILRSVRNQIRGKFTGERARQGQPRAVGPEIVGGNAHNDGNQGEIDALCIVCVDNKVNTCFYKCGHMCCCEFCAGRIRGLRCPLCRKPIEAVIRAYVASGS
eukprot:TRINITY_DN13059_c0_g2_i1.p1 TRINITY_DN13059_c0_g2~~TRINITY_DN13059_c0_g2_i1.p1  ORF type:complete len:328 (+),score=11.45 TRINITY_DN13059_c0_g2_i1:47-1030(+)